MPVRAWLGRRDAAGRWIVGSAVRAALLALGAMGDVSAAQAQWSGQLSVINDERWRGRSISDGRPAATASLGYDDRSGAYADVSATAAALPQGLALVSVGMDAGYAWRGAGGHVIDLGVTRREFLSGAALWGGSGYSEVYAGISGRSLSARLHYSPDYLRRGKTTLYATLDGVARPTPAVRLLAHVGVMRFLGTPGPYSNDRVQIDYHLGVARRIGRIDTRLLWTDGLPGEDFYRGRERTRRAVTLALSYDF